MKPILMQTFTETLTRVDRKDGSIVFEKKKTLFIYWFIYLFNTDNDLNDVNANIIHYYITIYSFFVIIFLFYLYIFP